MDSNALGQPLRDRDLTAVEVEQFRLLLSTYCDGSGARYKEVPWTVPDYRDFERVTATVCGGSSAEDKGIFDVSVPVPNAKPYGISCKMALPGLNDEPWAAFIELSNSSSKFTNEFNRLGIDWRTQPELAGPATVDLVMTWHHEVAHEIDLANSYYLLLTRSRNWRQFRMAVFDLNLWHAARDEFKWEVRYFKGKASSIIGTRYFEGKSHRVWEFYPLSGGQLKYRPLWEWAVWRSDWFELELPPQFDLKTKGKQYFPDLWVD